MRNVLGQSSLGAAIILAGASLASAQPPVTSRCFISSGVPNAAPIRFVVPDPFAPLPPPQGIWVESPPAEVGLAVRFASAASGQERTPTFIVVSPSSVVTPGWVWVGLDRNVVPSMSSGVHALVLRFSPVDEPDKVCQNEMPPISLMLGGGGRTPAVTSVVNAATSEPEFSPGTIITIKGSNLGAPPIDARYDTAGLFPTKLGTTSVFWGRQALPLLHVSPERIDAVIPHSIPAQATDDLVVLNNNYATTPYRLSLQTTSPGIYTENTMGGGLAIYNQNGAQNGEGNPAATGSRIQLRATGVGAWNYGFPAGSIALSTFIRLPRSERIVLRPQATISLTIGSQPTEISDLGPVPYEIFGTLNIVAVIPDGLTPGPQPIVLKVGENDNARQNVTVWVQ